MRDNDHDAHQAMADYAESRLPGDGVRDGPAEGHPLRSESSGAMTMLCVAAVIVIALAVIVSLIMRGPAPSSARSSGSQPVECAKPAARGVTT